MDFLEIQNPAEISVLNVLFDFGASTSAHGGREIWWEYLYCSGACWEQGGFQDYL